MADTITAQTATDQPVRRETVHTEIIMAKVDIITVTMVTDQPVREITEARDQTAETRDRSTTEDRDRDSIRGDRSGGRNNNFRGRDNGGRLDREIDKFNKDSAPLAEEMRGKETRGENVTTRTATENSAAIMMF